MKNEQIVRKIIQYIDKILLYTKGMHYENFLNNSMVLEACVFNLSQMGELVKKVDKSYEKANDHIPWRQIYGLRNKIVHDYEGVNFMLVWSIINEGESVESQISGAFDVLSQRLETIGLTLQAVVQMDCLFKNINDLNYPEKIIKERFDGKYLARKAFETKFIREGIDFQIDAIAFKGN